MAAGPASRRQRVAMPRASGTRSAAVGAASAQAGAPATQPATSPTKSARAAAAARGGIGSPAIRLAGPVRVAAGVTVGVRGGAAAEGSHGERDARSPSGPAGGPSPSGSAGSPASFTAPVTHGDWVPGPRGNGGGVCGESPGGGSGSIEGQARPTACGKVRTTGSHHLKSHASTTAAPWRPGPGRHFVADVPT